MDESSGSTNVLRQNTSLLARCTLTFYCTYMYVIIINFTVAYTNTEAPHIIIPGKTSLGATEMDY